MIKTLSKLGGQALLVGLLCLMGASFAEAQVKYGQWKETDQGNFIRKCTLPRGAHQYLCIFSEKPEWVYWYNPATQKFWCCCPTARHPDFGARIKRGEDLFLMATEKGSTIDETVFPDDPGPNFTRNPKAKDKDGSEVPLDCPPADLPPGI